MAGGFKIHHARPAGSPPPPPPSDLSVTVRSPNLNAATIGLAYAWDAIALGGTEPYSYSLFAGTMMTNVAFDTASGGASGFPTTAQTRTGLVVKVTDALGATAVSAAFDVVVTDPAWRDVPTTTATFFANMLAAIPGDRLVLAAGAYTIDVGSITKAGVGIQLLGQAGVTFTYISLNTCRGFWLKNILVTGTNGFGISVFCPDSTQIVCDGLSFVSGTGTGMLFSGDKCVVQNSNVNGISGDAISGVNATNFLVTSNVIKNWNANAITVYGVTGYIVEKNAIGAFIDPGDGGHPDTIAVSSYTGRGANGTIRWNRYDRLSGAAGTNGIGFLESNDHVNIYGNCNFGASANGASDSLCTFITKRNNFVQALADNSTSKMLTRDGSDHIIMRDNFANVVQVILGTPDQVAAGYVNPTNYTITPNTIIPDATSKTDTTLRDNFLANNPQIPSSPA